MEQLSRWLSILNDCPTMEKGLHKHIPILNSVLADCWHQLQNTCLSVGELQQVADAYDLEPINQSTGQSTDVFL